MNAIVGEVKADVRMLTEGLRTRMRQVLESSLYLSPEERVCALQNEYREHIYVKGVFSQSDCQLVFTGEIDTVKTTISCHG